MRRRSPIRIIQGRVYCWAKANASELEAINEFYHRGTQGYPTYILMRPARARQEKRQILSFPRPSGVRTLGEGIFTPR